MTSISGDLLAMLAVLVFIIAIAVKISTKFIRAQRDSFVNCLVASAIAIVVQTITLIVAPDSAITLIILVAVTGVVFSMQLGVPFFRALLIAFLSFPIALWVMNATGIVDISFGV